MSERKVKNSAAFKKHDREPSGSSVIVVKELELPEIALDKRLQDLVTGVVPVSYEDALVQHRNEISRDPQRDLLLFPEDDVVAYKEPRELRTEYSTVLPQAFKDATSLLVKECLKAYTCEWYIIKNQYDSYGHSYQRLPQFEKLSKVTLLPQVFETDVDLDEVDGEPDALLAPTKEKGVYKEGYLTKSPFHSDGNPLYGSKVTDLALAKTYKRRWFTLKQTSNDGAYVLEYRKDEGSVLAKGTLYLDSCTQITKGLKGRMYGFELHIQDKVYGLAADSLGEMDSWVGALCKATGIELESEKQSSSRSFFGSKSAPKNNRNLKDSLKNSNHPLLQEFSKETDQGNAKKRQENRLGIFHIYPGLGNSFGVVESLEDAIEPFREPPRTRLLVSLSGLHFRLTPDIDASGNSVNCEPFFVSLALFDVKQGRKLTEDFNCDLNHPSIKEMLTMEVSKAADDELSPQQIKKEKFLHSPKKAVFSVSSPHPDIFLVLRVTKVLQGGIGQVVEPYLKSFDQPKVAQKIAKQARLVCKRVGKYRMPFGWAARPLFRNVDGELTDDGDFSGIFKQETSKLTDEEILKLLLDLKSEKLRQPVIPGVFRCTVSILNPNHPNCYSPCLIPLKPFSQSEDIEASLEVQLFSKSTTETATPFTDYVNNLYVYPISLNYSGVKGMKARNISCTIQLRKSDDLNAKPLKCIYKDDGTCAFTHEVTCPVLHHNTNPTFYKEVKVLLPPQLEPCHHILFIFHHVSVEIPKEGKKKDLESPVGFAWMPILDNEMVRSDESVLPVAAHLPEKYLDCKPLGLGKTQGPEVRWADGKGQPLFKVNTRLVSTTYTQDTHMSQFFTHWQSSEGKPSADVETSRLLKLMHAMETDVIIKFLPVILNQLLQVLITVSNEDVAVNVVSLLIRIVSLMHESKREKLLKTYVKFVFQLEPNNQKTVHEELGRHLIFYLKLGADPAMIANILQYSWFFFDIMIKSMAHCAGCGSRGGKPSENRDSRFKPEFLRSLEQLVQVFIYQLVSKAKDKPLVAKEANQNLAAFVKKCFTYMDRGFTLGVVNYMKDQYKPADTQMFELKFEFLRSVCEHEHYVALNLPLDIRTSGGVHESNLNDIYCKKHFLVGLLLREFSAALVEPKVVRKYALKVLRNLLVKHAFDDRYQTQAKQSRIAALYIPYLTLMLQHALRFHKSLDRPLIDDSLLSTHQINAEEGGRTPVRTSLALDAYSPPQPSMLSIDPTGKTPPILPFDDDEAKELLVCMLYIIKTLDAEIVVDWWRDILSTGVKPPSWVPSLYYVQANKMFSKFIAIIDFFDLLECCIKVFRYVGKKPGEESAPASESAKLYLEEKYSSTSKVLGMKLSSSVTKQLANVGVTDSDAPRRALLETNMSTEVALITLDMIELFCVHFKFYLGQDDGDNVIMKKIFNVLMTFLRVSQSEFTLRHVFASLRSFIHKFPSALFKGSANLCGVLCYEILRLCNSKIESVRTQACSFMYLLLRSNYEYSGTGCVRVHLQIIVAVSKLIASGMNRASMNHSLIMLKNYAAEDKGLKNTEFPSEVRDLIKKVHTVLQATAQMKEHEDDLEVLIDLQYSLAKSYASTPELRQTWLQSMAIIHEKAGDFSEAAMCYVHAAALVAEYLKRKGSYPGGCLAFKTISPNLVPDESVMKDDEGEAGEMRYTSKDLIELLETCADRLKMAERYEVMGEVYKLAIPLYELERNYRCLALAYSVLKEAYDKVVEVMASGKRLLGRYFRVAFYGRAFKDDDGKEFVYKEPKVTSLAEVSQRLLDLYNAKYGNVKLVQDSAKVKPEELNPAVHYVQVTFVQPYFDEEEFEKRQTDFERENNIRRFVFETPYTLAGKAHGALSEQHKRKTILTTSHSFPYVKKRILVVQQEIYELAPLEVAIDEMQSKVKELNHVISLDPPDMKKLQLKLQGSVSVQVNAGPLAYAKTFLESGVIKDYPAKHIDALQQIYREFVRSCGKALDMNSLLIKSDQQAYQDDLREKFLDLKAKVATYVGEVSMSDLPVSGSISSFSEA